MGGFSYYDRDDFHDKRHDICHDKHHDNCYDKWHDDDVCDNHNHCHLFHLLMETIMVREVFPDRIVIMIIVIITM